MSDYARAAAQRDADNGLRARDLRNATSQEREKYNATFADAQKK